jgi:hypothetical protein
MYMVRSDRSASNRSNRSNQGAIVAIEGSKEVFDSGFIDLLAETGFIRVYYCLCKRKKEEKLEELYERSQVLPNTRDAFFFFLF